MVIDVSGIRQERRPSAMTAASPGTSTSRGKSIRAEDFAQQNQTAHALAPGIAVDRGAEIQHRCRPADRRLIGDTGKQPGNGRVRGVEKAP